MNFLASWRTVLVLAIAIVAAEPLLFWEAFAGDAQVHLVFMESASQGRLYEFNPGEVVSGETSPGYMLLGAFLFRTMPAAAVPIALKLTGLLSWYAFSWLVWRVARQLLMDETSGARRWSLVAGFIAATISGSVFNANVGMENGLFAALIWAWIWLGDRWGWFDGKVATGAQEVVLASLLGFSAWLRPEGAIVAIVALAFRFTRMRAAFRAWLPGTVVVLLFCGAAVLFQLIFTHDLIATSILSRRILAMPQSVALGPVSLDLTLVKRLLFYFPLTAFFLWGLQPSAETVKPTERFLRLLFGVFVVLYSMTGTPQLARYLIFLMPILVIGAVRGARSVLPSPRGRVAVTVGALVIVAVNLADLRVRLRSNMALLQQAVAAPARRRTATDKLLAQVPNPSNRPLVVATESVQIRYEVDQRVIVRSLDGRVDRALMAFAQGGLVDHLGYLKMRQVDYLLQTTNYNRDQTAWSLKALRGLRPGQMLRHDGVSFRAIGNDRYAVVIP